MIITANSNKKIKQLKALYKDKKLRQQQNVYIAEGVNFVKDLPSDNRVLELYIKQSEYEHLSYLEQKFGIDAYKVADGVFDAVADTVSPSGVIAVVKRAQQHSDLGEFVLVLDGISDAGNLGTIVRTASARGIKTIICIDTTDPYSPKAVRASMGGINNANIVACDTKEAIELLKGYDIITLDMGQESFYEYKLESKTALVVGSEAHGVSKEFLAVSKKILTIPMEKNSVESLNAAVSAGIAMYLIRK